MLVILRGLPASGKSTWAKQWVTEDSNRVRVNRDDIRKQFFETPTYEQAQEKMVTTAEHTMVEALLRGGNHVVVDDTNLKAKYVKNFLKIAKKVGVGSKVVDFPISVATAIEYDSARENPVGEEVIRRFSRYLGKNDRLPPVPELKEDDSFGAPYQGKTYLPAAILVDIDGTVAVNDHRGYHEYEKVLDDKPNLPVVRVVQALRRAGYKLVFLSGRPDWCKEETKQWLRRHVGEHFHGPYMRKTGDFRNDSIIKPELFDAHVRHNFNIIASLDDRDRVVRAWRNMGITCLQVADGDF